MWRLRLLSGLVLLIAGFGAPAYAQPRNVTVQFMAPEANWGDPRITGHAFICIRLETGSQRSEECFGFYARKNGKALVGGPGVVDREFDFSRTARPVPSHQTLGHDTDYGGEAPAALVLHTKF